MESGTAPVIESVPTVARTRAAEQAGVVLVKLLTAIRGEIVANTVLNEADSGATTVAPLPMRMRRRYGCKAGASCPAR